MQKVKACVLPPGASRYPLPLSTWNATAGGICNHTSRALIFDWITCAQGRRSSLIGCFLPPTHPSWYCWRRSHPGPAAEGGIAPGLPAPEGLNRSPSVDTSPAFNDSSPGRHRLARRNVLGATAKESGFSHTLPVESIAASLGCSSEDSNVQLALDYYPTGTSWCLGLHPSPLSVTRSSGCGWLVESFRGFFYKLHLLY
jgi:hypothetical protein